VQVTPLYGDTAIVPPFAPSLTCKRDSSAAAMLPRKAAVTSMDGLILTLTRWGHTVSGGRPW
jgi:hypothetical protein